MDAPNSANNSIIQQCAVAVVPPKLGSMHTRASSQEHNSGHMKRTHGDGVMDTSQFGYNYAQHTLQA